MFSLISYMHLKITTSNVFYALLNMQGSVLYHLLQSEEIPLAFLVVQVYWN